MGGLFICRQDIFITECLSFGYCKVSLASDFKDIIMSCQINHPSVWITVGVVIDVNVFSVLMCILPLLSRCDGNY